MKFHIYILSFLSLWIFTSCGTTQVYKQLKHLQFNDYALPENTKTIVLLNAEKQNHPTNALNKDSGRRLIFDQIYGSDGPNGYVIKKMRSQLQRNNFYQVEYIVESINRPVPWSEDKVENYVKGNEILMVLEHLNTGYILKTEKTKKHQLDTEGKDYYIDVVESRKFYTTEIGFGIYDGNSGKEWDYYEEKAYAEISAQGLTTKQARIKLDSLTKGFEKHIVDSLTRVFADKMIPNPVYDTWIYYSKGSGELDEGRKYMELGKIEAALSIYKKGLNHVENDSLLQAKYHYNIGTTLHILGKNDAALSHAEQAYILDDKGMHKRLFEKIKSN